ncbi:sensor histidine kinase [Kineococcus rhizosphaerae]|uniref:histidine kinase n=1 Tax=Kineococcus rhizosphaerae TaxID=559628 RepID=A0A2T0QXK2_9ACTN|nr:HAMP domain-containing sensor histidine kinase [Kineococcus rhizosphaerae]PRY10776.1 signal transduction histidine kinase [Kineococcus rhizosphaerae]
MSLRSAARWVATLWRECGVQVRSTVAATLVQGLVVLAAGGLLLLSLVHDLRTGVDAATLSTAQSIAALVPDSVTESPGLRSAIEEAARRRQAVQVLDENGAVVASSPELRGSRAVVGDQPAPGATERRKVRLPFDDDPYRVTVLGGEVSDDGRDRRFTVVVAQSVGTGEDTLHAAVVAMAVAGPLLLLTVGFATYVFVGRSLRPVTRIRSTVEGISHRDLSERVPIPPGRDEVARLATTMNSMLTGLERADAAQRQFVSDASHELRSPIATLRAAADIALTQPERTDPRDLARLVRGEARRLDGLVADLLLLARVDERGRARTATDGEGVEEVDLDDLVTDEHRRLRAATTLNVTMHREPARVLGDPRELSRVLRNLTDNAARHAHHEISVDLRRNGSRALLTVWNDGAPIPPADRDRVFDRFVRLEESRTRDSGGSGLGLAIVREVVAAHGGSVRVLDVAAGTGFRVELPLAGEFDAGPGR